MASTPTIEQNNLKALLLMVGLENKFALFIKSGIGENDDQNLLFGHLLNAVRHKCGLSLPDSENKENEVIDCPRANFVDNMISNISSTPTVAKKKKIAGKSKSGKTSNLKQMMAEKRRQKEAALANNDNSTETFISVDPEMMIDSLVEVNHLPLETLYVMNDAIAKGNFGVVYLGHSKNTNQNESSTVAIKQLKKMTHTNVCAIARETKIMKILNGHHGLVQLIDVFETETLIHLVLEFIPGGDLLHAITLHSSYSEFHARDMCQQLISALKYMHSKLIVHLDLKPDNLMCQSFEMNQESLILKITDFGVSKILSNENEKITKLVGTPKYSGPEAHQSAQSNINNKNNENGYFGKPADVWSLGAIVYCLLTGSGPFYHVPPSELKDKMNCGKIHYDRNAWSPVSNDALKFVQCLCDIDPSKRPTMETAMLLPWMTKDFMQTNVVNTSESEQQEPPPASNELSSISSTGPSSPMLKPLRSCVHGLRSSIAKRKHSKLFVESLLASPTPLSSSSSSPTESPGTPYPSSMASMVWPTSLSDNNNAFVSSSQSSTTTTAEEGDIVDVGREDISCFVKGRTIRTISTIDEDDYNHSDLTTRPYLGTGNFNAKDHENYLKSLQNNDPEEFALEMWHIAQDYALHEIKQFTQEEVFHEIHEDDETPEVVVVEDTGG